MVVVHTTEAATNTERDRRALERIERKHSDLKDRQAMGRAQSKGTERGLCFNFERTRPTACSTVNGTGSCSFLRKQSDLEWTSLKERRPWRHWRCPTSIAATDCN